MILKDDRMEPPEKAGGSVSVRGYGRVHRIRCDRDGHACCELFFLTDRRGNDMNTP